MERSIQAIKRKLGTMKLVAYFFDIQSAISTIIDDMHLYKHRFIGCSFIKQFGRKPNTEFSLARDEMFSRNVADNIPLERAIL